MKKIIGGVPLISQKPNWCGYTCLAMVLQFWDYKLSPEDLFRHLYGEEQEVISHDAQIGIGNLAMGVQALTPLKVRLYSMEVYERLKGQSTADYSF